MMNLEHSETKPFSTIMTILLAVAQAAGRSPTHVLIFEFDGFDTAQCLVERRIF